MTMPAFVIGQRVTHYSFRGHNEWAGMVGTVDSLGNGAVWVRWPIDDEHLPGVATSDPLVRGHSPGALQPVPPASRTPDDIEDWLAH